MANNTYSSATIVDLGNVFVNSIEHVLGNYLPESRKVVDAFVTHVVLQEKPYMLATEEGVVHARSIVFSVEAVRDFVLSLSYVFFGRWGGGPDDAACIANFLAAGVSFTGHGEKSQFDRMPVEMSGRLESHGDAYNLLLANKWLMVLLLMQMFVRFSDATKTNAKK